MSKCDDDIILEAYLNKHLKEDFDFFEGDLKNDKKVSSETKAFETPKSKLTEDEAKEFFINSDEFHQAFHNFMKETGYGEKEVDGKEMWCKCAGEEVCQEICDEDEQEPVQQDNQQITDGQQVQSQQPVQQNQNNNGNVEQQKQEIIDSLSQMTPDQIAATYQAIFN